MVVDNTRIVAPQPGPQEAFLSSSADIAIYGGAAGAGKTWAVLLEPLRHVTTNAEFSALFFRSTTVQIRNPGGLWDESRKVYPLAHGSPNSSLLEWKWPGGGKVKMSYLEHESSVLDWQGAQIPLIIFDELTHFSKTQFFYLLSRNRSMCGVRPYVRATCNPDADSWVAEFISWWIDQETGFPIPERSGVVRWFVRIGDDLIWGDSRAELTAKYNNPLLPEDHEDQVRPKSVTFVPGKLTDNRALMVADPDYKANLMALSRVERARLLDGNWKIRPAAGMYFKRTDITVVDSVPDDIVKIVRRWDLAATELTDASPDPDWTAGVKIGRRSNGRFIVLHVARDRLRAAKVRELVRRTAVMDSVSTYIGLPQDPGQAGKEQSESYVSDMAGFVVEVVRETGDKIVRAEPFASQWQNNNVDVLRAPWNEAFFAELEAFGDGKSHDDQVDAASGAFIMLSNSELSIWAALGR